MENTIEEKSRFYGLHIGCTLYGNSLNKSNKLTISNISAVVINYTAPLLLTPLSQITDEDRYWLCSQMAYRVDESNFKEISDAAVNHLLDFNKWSGSTILYIIDFLRSKGYALPWMGLSVEQMVSFGWVKLKEA